MRGIFPWFSSIAQDFLKQPSTPPELGTECCNAPPKDGKENWHSLIVGRGALPKNSSKNPSADPEGCIECSNASPKKVKEHWHSLTVGREVLAFKIHFWVVFLLFIKWFLLLKPISEGVFKFSLWCCSRHDMGKMTVWCLRHLRHLWLKCDTCETCNDDNRSSLKWVILMCDRFPPKVRS